VFPIAASLLNGHEQEPLPVALGIAGRSNRLEAADVPEADQETRRGTARAEAGVRAVHGRERGMVQLSPLLHSRR
jgi:hypothetical protein